MPLGAATARVHRVGSNVGEFATATLASAQFVAMAPIEEFVYMKLPAFRQLVQSGLSPTRLARLQASTGVYDKSFAPLGSPSFHHSHRIWISIGIRNRCLRIRWATALNRHFF
jgi:hypothetical protein